MNLYARQQDLSPPRTLLIVGCGGVGSWAAIIAALAGVENIILVDYDTIEEHNLNRLPFPPSSVNTHKATTLKNFISSLRPHATIVALTQPVDTNILKAITDQFILDAIIDCTDRFNVQKKIYAFSKEYHIPYIKAGCDLSSVTIHTTVPDWGDAPDGYTTIPTWAGTAAIAGALAIAETMGEKITITTPQEAYHA